MTQSSEQKQPVRDRGYLSWLMLAVFSFIAFTFRLGSYPLTDRDETLYSQVAKELLGHHDWWTLYWQGHPWFIHAPLAMWIEAAVFRTFGVTELTARMSAVFFGVGLVMLTAAFGTLLFNRRVGLFAGLVMVSSPIVFMIARMAILDMPFTFFITLSIFLFVLAWRTRNPKLYPVFWLSLGFATLGKGLWGMALPVMVSFLYAITDKERKRLLDWRLYASAIVWAAVAMPWIIVGAHRHGKDFLEPVFITNTVARLTTSVCEHRGPWWFYLPYIILGLFPWSVLWPRAFFAQKGDNGRLLFLWIVPALILHSSAKTKLPNYMLPFMPAYAIMLAAYIAEARSKTVQGWVLPVIGGLISAGVLFGLRSVKWLPWHPDPVTVIACLVGAYGLAGYGLARLKDRGMVLAAVCLVFVATLIPMTYAKISGELSPKSISRQARAIAGDGPVMVVLGTGCEGGIYYYADAPFVRLGSVNEAVRVLSARKEPAVMVLDDTRINALTDRGIKFKIINRTHKWILARAIGDH